MHYYKPTWLDLVRFFYFFPLMITHGITTKAQFYAREAIVMPVAGQMSDFFVVQREETRKRDWGLGGTRNLPKQSRSSQGPKCVM